MFIKINDEIIKVKVCHSQKEISEGMMGKKFIGFDGMLFLMSEGNHSIWMKNCIIPLDIIFINSDLSISGIHHNCNPCKFGICESYEGYGKYVLEIEGGRCQDENIEEGDICKFLIKV